jgi:hypothetical protein
MDLKDRVLVSTGASYRNQRGAKVMLKVRNFERAMVTAFESSVGLCGI